MLHFYIYNVILRARGFSKSGLLTYVLTLRDEQAQDILK